MQRNPIEVRLHPAAPCGILALGHVPRLEGSPQRLLRLAEWVALDKDLEFYDQSMAFYDSPRIFCDLREGGLTCGQNRVGRLMKSVQIKLVRGSKRPWICRDNASLTSGQSVQVLTGGAELVPTPVPTGRAGSAMGDRCHLHPHSRILVVFS